MANQKRRRLSNEPIRTGDKYMYPVLSMVKTRVSKTIGFGFTCDWLKGGVKIFFYPI